MPRLRRYEINAMSSNDCAKRALLVLTFWAWTHSAVIARRPAGRILILPRAARRTTLKAFRRYKCAGITWRRPKGAKNTEVAERAVAALGHVAHAGVAAVGPSRACCKQMAHFLAGTSATIWGIVRIAGGVRNGVLLPRGQ